MIEFTLPQAAGVLPVAFASPTYENIMPTFVTGPLPVESVGQGADPTLPPKPKTEILIIFNENMATTLAPYTPPSESVGQVFGPALPPQPK